MEEPVVQTNDLERVRTERIKKFSKKDAEQEVKIEEPIRRGLLGQILGDQQVDTEELLALAQPKGRDIPYELVERKDIPSSSTQGTQTSRFVNALRTFGLSSVVPESTLLTPRKQRSKLLEGEAIRALETLPESLSYLQSFPVEPPPETIGLSPYTPTATSLLAPPFSAEEVLQRSEIRGLSPYTPTARGPAELISEAPSEFTPLSKPTLELGFGGLSEQPIQTSVGQFLPPAPVSQEELLRRQQQEAPPTILEALPYVTERLIKEDIPPEPAPLASAEPIIVQAEAVEQTPTPAEQLEAKWTELRKSGLLKTRSTKPSPKKAGESVKKSSDDWLRDIRSVTGYENFEPLEPVGRKKSGPAKKPVVGIPTSITSTEI